MGKALIIGAGGVAGVVVHKCCQNSEVFSEICIASRTKSKCDALKAQVEAKGTKTKVTTAQVDADSVPQLVELINREKPDIVINVALPYQDLTIMDACLETKTDYVDTANYEHPDTAKFEYTSGKPFAGHRVADVSVTGYLLFAITDASGKTYLSSEKNRIVQESDKLIFASLID